MGSKTSGRMKCWMPTQTKGSRRGWRRPATRVEAVALGKGPGIPTRASEQQGRPLPTAFPASVARSRRHARGTPAPPIGLRAAWMGPMTSPRLSGLFIKGTSAARRRSVATDVNTPPVISAKRCARAG